MRELVSGVGYLGQCKRCPKADLDKGVGSGKERQAIYLGESSKTSYRKFLQHFTGSVKKANKNWVWEDCRDSHGGVIGGEGEGGREYFHMSVTGSFHNANTRIADEASRLKREFYKAGSRLKTTQFYSMVAATETDRHWCCEFD